MQEIADNTERGQNIKFIITSILAIMALTALITFALGGFSPSKPTVKHDPNAPITMHPNQKSPTPDSNSASTDPTPNSPTAQNSIPATGPSDLLILSLTLGAFALLLTRAYVKATDEVLDTLPVTPDPSSL